jgi:UDP-glucose 4-epimerase
MPKAKPYALVTGAAGFLGAHLLRELMILDRVTPIALDDLSGGSRENIPQGIDFVMGSVCDAPLLSRLFEKYRFQYVYHLAAYAAEGLSHFIRRFNYTNNLIGSVNVINESVRHGVDCLVFTSSIAVYGAVPPPMLESTVPEPEDPYGVAKLAVELDLKAARHMFGLQSIIFRPHNVYGEYQNLSDPYRNVIGIFMKQILEGSPLTIFGDGKQRRAFSYVGDVTPLLAIAPWVPNARNQTFNVGADETYTVLQLAEEVAQAMGAPGHPIRHLEARNEVTHAYADHRKVREIFGDQMSVPLRDGLARMSRWARQTTVLPVVPFSAIEVEKNLPPSWANQRK